MVKAQLGSRVRRAIRVGAAGSAAAIGLLFAVSQASAAGSTIPGTSCTVTASAPGPSFGGGISCSGSRSYSASYTTCVQVHNANGNWYNTSTCGSDSGSLRNSGMGTSFAGFNQVSGHSYRVHTSATANGHAGSVNSAGFGTTTVG